MATESLTDSQRETLALFDESEPPWTTKEVAQQLDLGRRTAYHRLDQLVELDELETKKVGASARIWWRHASTATSSSAGGGEAEARLGGNTDQFDLLIDAVEEYAIFMLDSDGYVQTWNTGAERIKGHEPEEIVGEHFSTFYTDEDREADVPERNLETAVEDGSVEDEGWRIRVDGTRFWANVTITAIRDDAGDLKGFAKITRDMTDRRAYERQLAEQAERLQRQRDDLKRELDNVFDRIDDAFYALDDEFRFEYVNGRAETYFDASAGELLGQVIWEALDIDEDDPLIEQFETAMETQEPTSHERYSDLLGIWNVARVYPGESGLSVYFSDITERKQTERALQRSEERFRTLMEHSPFSIQIFDAEGRSIAANPAWERLWDASREELTDYNILRDEQLEAAGILPDIRDAFAGDIVTLPIVHYDPGEVGKPGRARWIEGYVYPLLRGDEETYEVALVHHDVTERKERERELERYEMVVETVWDGITVLDSDDRFVLVNEEFCEITGYDREEVVGEHATLILDESAYEQAGDLHEEVLDGNQATATLEYNLLTADGGSVPVEARFGPCEFADGTTGGTGVIRDVSERKERERELERYETIIEAIDDGVYVLDDEFCFIEVNDKYAEMTGYDREELLGAPCTLVIDEEVSAESAERLQEIIAGDAESATLEADILRADGSRLRAESNFAAMETADADQPLKVGVVRDISDRVARERALEEARNRYRTLIENFPNGAVTLVDEDLHYSAVGGTPLEEANATVESLEGRPLDEVLPEGIADVVIPRYVDAFEGEGSVFEEEIGDKVYEFRVLPVRNDDGDVFAALGMSQDITEQKERERELRNRVRQQQAVTDLGQRALSSHEFDELMAEAAELVADTLDNDYCKVLDFDADAEELFLRQGVGWDDGVVGTATVSSVEADSQAAYTLESERPVNVEDLDTESRFDGPELLTSHGVRSGISTIIGSFDDPWGILGTHDTESKQFTQHDVNFVQSVANILASAIQRHEHERELVSQREQLMALNNLNEVFQNITVAVIEQSTREEIEETLCEGIAGVDSFSFAWIGDVDPTQTLALRNEAGVEGYFDAGVISIDPEDGRSQGPCGQAFLTRDVQIARGIQTDPKFEAWREQAETHGIRSVAGVPIVDDDRIYGVLGIYADRPNAFEEAEQRVLGQLGEIVGHAIAAVEQKRALMSDEVIELEFYMEDGFAAMGIDAPDEGRITLDHAVPAREEEHLVYGIATEDAWPALEELVATLPHWTDLTELGTSEGTRRFELRVNEPPVLSTVASRGGYVESVQVEDGDIRLIAHLPPTGNVRDIKDAVTDAYPTAELLAQRQISRNTESSARLNRIINEELTDRQRAALNAAFNTGFFEWPREATGEEVADSLGVSPPTFHQHLRKAEQKVFQTVLSTVVPS